MEHAVIKTLAEKMASIVADKLFEEVWLVINFKDDFEFICEEVNSINSLLNDARGKTASNSIVNWVDKVQDFLYDAVYLVEEFEDRQLNFFNIRIVQYQMGRRIRALRKRIKRIHSSAKYLKYTMSVLDADVLLHASNAYDLEEQYSRRKRSAILDRCQSDTVGLTGDMNKIIEWILKEGYGVIAVAGMGGSGKSHLVQNVFNSREVQEGFDYLVWLSVSQKFSAKELLLVTARQYLKLGEEVDQGHKMSKLSELKEVELSDRINRHLSEKRCLFVLDDVWQNDDVWKKDAWEKIGLLLSSDGRNKIVVTTRDKEVAAHIGNRPRETRYIHKMEKLSDDDSWKLFLANADLADILPAKFPGNIANASPQEHYLLTSIACQIVRKCSGLPLAVKTIAASMKKLKMVPNEWESTLKALDRPGEGEGDIAHVMHSLRFSYRALPARLKPCFLYCSAFPPHSRIKSEYLVHLWIAEGFISTPTRDAGDAIDVGRSYLNKLINLCMIEISSLTSDGRVKYCMLHDLLHNLAFLQSRQESKCLLKPGKELKEVPMDECKGVRRISLIKNEISRIIDDDQASLPCPGLRTLLLWNNAKLKSIPKNFFDNLKYLVVLDLSQTCIDELPTSIKNAKHLKLLNLSQTKIRELPDSLSGLKHLQYLDVSGCEDLKSLHSGIGRHKYMLHLNVKRCKNLKTLPAGISKLIYLRTLKGARVSSTATTPDLKWTDLRGLIRLQSLSVTLIDAASESPGLEGTFEGLTDMRTLYFGNTINSARGRLQLPVDTRSMQRLERVHLCNCLVPTWMFRLQNLMVLVIEGDNASAEYEGLQNIPNLKKLHLSHNKNCREFPKEFEEREAFPNLEKLMLEDFISLENFPSLEKGAMPKLNRLLMKNCSLEKRLALGLPTRVKVEVLPNKPAPETSARIIEEGAD